MNWLSWRSNLLKMKTSEKLPITNEAVGFEKQPVEDEDYRKITPHR
jgi:hypothetical protein